LENLKDVMNVIISLVSVSMNMNIDINIDIMTDVVVTLFMQECLVEKNMNIIITYYGQMEVYSSGITLILNLYTNDT
jgi:hypothetical protein